MPKCHLLQSRKSMKSYGRKLTGFSKSAKKNGTNKNFLISMKSYFFPMTDQEINSMSDQPFFILSGFHAKLWLLKLRTPFWF